MGQKTVLCVQDGSDLDYNRLDQCAGPGVIGSNQTGAKSHGLHLHPSLAIAPDGLPSGVLRADCEAPREKSAEDPRPGHAVPALKRKRTSSGSSITVTWSNWRAGCRRPG